MGLEKVNPSNFIHPTSIVEDSVSIGSGNYIGPFCYITGNTTIGNNNRFEAHCSIGTPPEHTNTFFKTDGRVVIGDDNIFREFITVHSGATRITSIGNKNKLLRGSYVGHDSILEDFITLSSNVLIGGYCYVMSGVNFGLGSMCHQCSKIGGYSMIGMGTVITKQSKIIPGGVYIGSPAKFLKHNSFGLEKHSISQTQLEELIHKYNLI